MSKKKEVIAQNQGEGQEQGHECLTENGCGTVAIQHPAPIPPSTQFLTADDILTSCGPPIAWEVPQLPRNGKPSIVFIKQPSFDTMNSFWSSRKEGKIEVEETEEGEVFIVDNDKSRNRVDEASALMRFLFVQEDGITPLFTDAQVSHIKEARFDVFQRLQEGVNSVVQPIMKGSSGESPNPFEEKEETN